MASTRHSTYDHNFHARRCTDRTELKRSSQGVTERETDKWLTEEGADDLL